MTYGATVDPIYGLMLDFPPLWAISSGVERFLHTEEATGSIPVSPTMVSTSPFPIHTPRVARTDCFHDVA